MSSIVFSKPYQNLSNLRLKLGIIERQANDTLNTQAQSTFDLLKKYEPTKPEKRALSTGFLNKLRIFFRGYNREVEQNISDQLQAEEGFEKRTLSRLYHLKAPSKVTQEITSIFKIRKEVLKDLMTASKVQFWARNCVFASSVLTVSYFGYHTLKDWTAHCDISSEFEEIKAFHNQHCPKADPWGYFSSLSTQFLALPVILMIGSALQIYDSEIISKVFFSPLEKIKGSSTSILQKVSHIKDYLLDSQMEPAFARPIVLKAWSE